MPLDKILQINDTQRPVIASFPFPEIDPIIFSIGPLSFRWYALAYITGILLGWLLLRRLTASPQDDIGRPPLDDLINYGIIGIIIGGRLGYVLGYNAGYYFQNPIEILYVWNGGMSFHGGFAGMVASIILVARKHKVSILGLGDLIALAAPIGLFFGRIANFINGELYGRVTDVPWGIVFPNGGPLARHPSQLYEALLEGLLLFVIIGLAYRKGARKKPGLMIGLFLTGYAAARIIVEYVREPDAHLGLIFNYLTMGQILSIPMLVLGVYTITFALKKPVS